MSRRTSHDKKQSSARWANWAVVPRTAPGWPKNSSIARLKSFIPVLPVNPTRHTGHRSCPSAVNGPCSAISRWWNCLANANTDVVLPNPGNASTATPPLALSPSWALESTMSHRSSCSSANWGVRSGPRLACHSRRARL
jgi:hypothetical protein